MSTPFLLTMIAGMTAVTVFSRLAPTLLVQRYRPGPRLSLWLNQVPPAVMAAIVLPALITPEGNLDLSGANTGLWIGLATIAIALLSKNFYLTILGGLGLMVAVSVVF